MADYSVTAASVVKTSTTSTAEGVAGATITAGQILYIDTAAAGVLKLGDAGVSATSVVAGIALHGAASGQPIRYATSGNLTFNAAFTAGANVFASETAGGICPFADLVSGDFVTLIGIATSTTNLKIGILSSETALA